MGTLPNPNLPVTEARLQEFYQQIKPYLGLREMPSGDMGEIVSPKPVTAKGGHRYSTEEQIVGTWIDGSTLYEKTLVGKFGTITDGTESRVTLDISSLNVELAFVKEGFIFNGSNTQSLNDTYGNTAQYQIRSVVSLPNQNVIAFCNRGALSNSDVYITIRYIKTT